MDEQFQEWVRAHAKRYLKSKGLEFDVVKCQVDDIFKEFIVQNYLCPLTQIREEHTSGNSLSLAALGRRYGGVHGETINRWFNDADVKISNLAIVYAAENAKFRNGNRIAVDAYVFAVQKVCELVGRPLSVASPLSMGLKC